jgi:hypothetical protein
VKALIEFMWLGLEQVIGCCEHGNEPPYSMKWGEFIEYQQNYQTFKNKLLHGFSWLHGWLVGWLVGWLYS